MRRSGNRPRRSALRHLRDRPNMRRRGSAASADDIQPAVLDEFLELLRERFRRLQILVFFVRQPRVRIAGNPRRRHLRERADVIRHQIRTRGAIQSDRQQIGMCDTEA